MTRGLAYGIAVLSLVLGCRGSVPKEAALESAECFTKAHLIDTEEKDKCVAAQKLNELVRTEPMCLALYGDASPTFECDAGKE